MNTHCLNCKDKLSGRSDKKYCSHYCRSNFHYEKNKGNPPTLFTNIDKILKNNRRLLLKFNQSGKSVIRKQKLLREGFKPRFFTHYWRNQKGEPYLFCYEMGFLEKKEKGIEKYHLVTYQEKYMGKV